MSKNPAVAELQAKFDAMLDQVQIVEHRDAIEALMQASSDELRQTLNKFYESCEGQAFLWHAKVNQEHLVKARIEAICVMGQADAAEKWLCQRCPALGDVPPAALLGSDEGLKLVLRELGAIEFGLPV